MKAIHWTFLFAALLFIACDPEEDPMMDPIEEVELCVGVECVHGECVDGDCICPPGWEGEFCEQIVVPSKIVFSNLWLTIPDPVLNDNWDANGPDQYPDLMLAIFADVDYIIEDVDALDADVLISLAMNVEGDEYISESFSVELPGTDFYNVVLFDEEGGANPEFMESAYIYFEFENDEEEPFPTDAFGFGTFNNSNVSFQNVEYIFD